MFEQMSEERRQRDDPNEFKKLRRGWFFGDDEFRQELLEQIQTLSQPHHGGEEKQESAEAKAQRLLSQELKRWGLKPTELQLRPKGDEAKVKVAAQLRSQTTMSWAWIAQELAMGSGGYVANCVRALSKE